MTIPITIDSCAWDFFFDKHYDLCVELPAEKFCLFITREVELELFQIPDDSKQGVDNRPLKEYIHNSIERREVQTTCVFGFNCGESPDDPARYGGFGQGTFISETERNWRQLESTQRYVIGASKGKFSVLRKNEADVSLAVASLSSVLITADLKKGARSGKKGPIHDAATSGGFVVYVQDVQSSGLTFVEYIEKHFSVSDGTLRATEAT